MCIYPPPSPCRSPPLVVPHPLSFPRGGGGQSLGQPKIFRCGSLCCCVGDCVVGHCHLYPLHSWQDILLTFAEMELDRTTMFPLGTNVMFIHSTGEPGEPVLAQVVGHSEHGDAYRRITFDLDGKTVLHDCASVWRLSNVRVQWWCGAPGGAGGPSLGDHPPGGGGGPSSLGWGTTRGGGVPTSMQQQLVSRFDLCGRFFRVLMLCVCGAIMYGCRVQGAGCRVQGAGCRSSV